MNCRRAVQTAGHTATRDNTGAYEHLQSRSNLLRRRRKPTQTALFQRRLFSIRKKLSHPEYLVWLKIVYMRSLSKMRTLDDTIKFLPMLLERTSNELQRRHSRKSSRSRQARRSISGAGGQQQRHATRSGQKGHRNCHAAIQTKFRNRFAAGQASHSSESLRAQTFITGAPPSKSSSTRNCRSLSPDGSSPSP